MYCPVSRAAIYKRIKEGNLSLFCYHVTEMKTNLLGKKREKIRGTPFGYVVVNELKAWRIELEQRALAGV